MRKDRSTAFATENQSSLLSKYMKIYRGWQVRVIRVRERMSKMLALNVISVILLICVFISPVDKMLSQ